MLTNNNFEINETVNSVANCMLDYSKRAERKFDANDIIDGMVEEFENSDFYKLLHEIDCTDAELVIYMSQFADALTAEAEYDEQLIKPTVIKLNAEQTDFVLNLMHKLSLNYFKNFNFVLQQFIDAVNTPVE